MQKPDAGFRLVDGRSIWDAIVAHNANSAAYGIVAAGTTQATATPLTSVLNQVDTTAASTGVNLPNSKGSRVTPYQWVAIFNNGASTLTVYAAQGTTDTINGVAAATGVTIPAGSSGLFNSAKPGVWFTGDTAESGSFTSITNTGITTTAGVNTSANVTFTAIGAGVTQKIGTNGRAGTVILTGTTAVTVSNTSIATSDVISFSLATVGGTVGGAPNLKTITAATGFTVAGSAGDTSTYNWIAQATSL